MCCKRSLFSAPRQLISVVKGREVIVNYNKKIRPVIFGLTLKFILPVMLGGEVCAMAGSVHGSRRQLMLFASKQVWTPRSVEDSYRPIIKR